MMAPGGGSEENVEKRIRGLGLDGLHLMSTGEIARHSPRVL